VTVKVVAADVTSVQAGPFWTRYWMLYPVTLPDGADHWIVMPVLDVNEKEIFVGRPGV
jgi:hypothetical protein